jgi:hypothetical protein
VLSTFEEINEIKSPLKYEEAARWVDSGLEELVWMQGSIQGSVREANSQMKVEIRLSRGEANEQRKELQGIRDWDTQRRNLIGRRGKISYGRLIGRSDDVPRTA